MKIKEIMTTRPATCTAESTLAQVAKKMAEHDCGLIPVVDSNRKLLGVITDRDVCLALSKKPVARADTKVKDIMTPEVHACLAADNVEAALIAMRRYRVRRLPVINKDHTLEGIIAMNDLILEARNSKTQAAVSYNDVMTSLKSICKHTSGGISISPRAPELSL